MQNLRPIGGHLRSEAKIQGSYHLLMLLLLWQHTKVSKTTKQNVAYLFATRGVYE